MGNGPAASADRLRAGIDGSGGGGQAKIAMSRQGRDLRGRTDGRVKAILPQSGVTACSNNSTFVTDSIVAVSMTETVEMCYSKVYFAKVL